jgi:hypothetical protein
MSVFEEAAYAERIRPFLELFNRRVGRPSEGQAWVRVRPPSVTEVEQLSTDLRCVKFLRVGALVLVRSLDPGEDGAVHAESDGDVLCFSRREFLGTFVRAVDWSSPGCRPPWADPRRTA